MSNRLNGEFAELNKMKFKITNMSLIATGLSLIKQQIQSGHLRIEKTEILTIQDIVSSVDRYHLRDLIHSGTEKAIAQALTVVAQQEFARNRQPLVSIENQVSDTNYSFIERKTVSDEVWDFRQCFSQALQKKHPGFLMYRGLIIDKIGAVIMGGEVDELTEDTIRTLICMKPQVQEVIHYFGQLWHSSIKLLEEEAVIQPNRIPEQLRTGTSN